MGYVVSLEYETLDEYRIQTLFFNSIVILTQFLRYKSEALGITRMKKNNRTKIRILNINSLSDEEKSSLLTFFNEISDIEFPSLIDQLESNFSYHRKLDSLILRIIKFPEKEIETKLDSLYKTIALALKNSKKSLSMSE